MSLKMTMRKNEKKNAENLTVFHCVLAVMLCLSGCSHLEVADAPQLGTVVSADTPVATGGVITNPEVTLPL